MVSQTGAQTVEHHRPVAPALRGAQLVLLTAVTAAALVLLPELSDRLLASTLTGALAVGVVGQWNAPPRESGLPVAAQGLVVGAALGAATVLVGVAGASPAFLPALLALPAQFPATIPRRLRPALTARWRDLVPPEYR